MLSYTLHALFVRSQVQISPLDRAPVILVNQIKMIKLIVVVFDVKISLLSCKTFELRGGGGGAKDPLPPILNTSRRHL